MQPAQLFLIGLLSTITTAALAEDGSERSQQTQERFLLSQQQIHDDNDPQLAANDQSAPSEPRAPTPPKADENI